MIVENEYVNDLIEKLESRLQSKHIHMDSIFELTQKVNSTIQVEQLFQLYNQFLTKYLGVKDLVLYYHSNEWEVKFFKSTLLKDIHSIEIADALKYKRFAKLEEEHFIVQGFKYVLPVFYEDKLIAFALMGDVQLHNVESEFYLLQYAQVITSIVAMAVENKKLLIREIEKKEFDKEMELASDIQGMIIPKKLPKNHLYEFAGLYLPHQIIGGDYYDVININKDEFVFCIGDISGKGVAAALVMANLQAYLNASPPLQMENIRELVDRLNAKVLSITNGEKFITLFLAKYNILSRELIYLNAGHNPPYLVDKDHVERLDKGCALLGILDNIPKVSLGRIKVQQGALILTFTDGLIDLESPNSENYGDERVESFVLKNGHLSAEMFLNELFKDINQFNNNTGFNDDVSILVGKFY